MKRWFWLPLLAIMPLFIFWVANKSKATGDSFSKTEEITLLRNIGHQLLLSSGDKTSRVLPVQELSTGNYRLRFEKPFSFIPNSLANIFAKNFTRRTEYSAAIIDCTTKAVVYSFVWSRDSTRIIIPCRERPMPKGCYELVIQLSAGNSSTAYYLAGFTVLLVVAGGMFLIKKQPQPAPVPATVENPSLPIGRFRFYIQQHKLELDGHFIELTGKESRLLSIFAQSPNTIIERSRLQKEVWEDEGVIVTRSLDMFVSKLRKKLDADNTVKIVNVHGKGYRLEIA